MAGGSLFTLLDDIAALMDDVAVQTSKATSKTVGLVGDDLALNAQQMIGIDPKRELPIVWEVTKGSLKNKAILIPAALGISALAPWAIPPLLMLGGSYLCYEGAEKLWHKFAHKDHNQVDEHGVHESTKKLVEAENPVETEKNKIKGAIRTDFILSAEIMTIALGAIAAAPLITQIPSLAAIGLGMTAGVYGAVAGIVKMDDAGLHLAQKEGDGLVAKSQRALGRGILNFAPKFMKTLSIVGTAAMFVVGGEILMHGIPGMEHIVHEGIHHLAHLAPAAGGVIETIGPMVAGAATGLLAGAAAIPAVSVASKAFNGIKKALGFDKKSAPEGLAEKSENAPEPSGPNPELEAAGPKPENDSGRKSAVAASIKGAPTNVNLKAEMNEAAHGAAGAPEQIEPIQEEAQVSTGQKQDVRSLKI